MNDNSNNGSKKVRTDLERSTALTNASAIAASTIPNAPPGTPRYPFMFAPEGLPANIELAILRAAVARLHRELAAAKGEILRRDTALEEKQLELDYEKMRAVSDPLTGLLNRRGFLEAFTPLHEAARTDNSVAQTMQQAALPKKHYALVLFTFDIDGLKQVNDTHGHAAGDAYISGFAGALKILTRSDDVLGRLGGDEFALIFRMEVPPGEANLAHVLSARRDLFMKRIETLDPIRHEELRLSHATSIGFAVVPTHIASPGAALEMAQHQADAVLYEHKAVRKGLAANDVRAPDAAVLSGADRPLNGHAAAAGLLPQPKG